MELNNIYTLVGQAERRRDGGLGGPLVTDAVLSHAWIDGRLLNLRPVMSDDGRGRRAVRSVLIVLVIRG